MSWLDIAIIVVIAVSTFMGLRAGLIKAVLSLAGAIAGVILAGRFSTSLAGQLTFIDSAEIAEIVAFAIILVGVMIIATVLASFLKWVASAMLLGWVNHLGGAIFGLALGAIFSGALLAMWVKWLGASGPVAESFLAEFLLSQFPLILAFLPGEFDSIRSFFQ
ncbi:CvpA family protein [Chloroflexota bacterium]